LVRGPPSIGGAVQEVCYFPASPWPPRFARTAQICATKRPDLGTSKLGAFTHCNRPGNGAFLLP